MPILLASVVAVASGETRKPSAASSKPPAATVQAVATVNQVHSSDGSEDSFWMFAVTALGGRNASIWVHSGADEHVCPTNFASATLLGPAKGGMLYDAQGHKMKLMARGLCT